MNGQRSRGLCSVACSIHGSVNLPKVIVMLLAAVAVIGITYGFSCFVDKVQTWASYNVGVQHLAQ